MSLDLVAVERGVKAGTIASHLATAIEKGVDVDIAVLGVTADIVAKVARVIHHEAVNSDVSRQHFYINSFFNNFNSFGYSAEESDEEIIRNENCFPHCVFRGYIVHSF